LSEFDSTDGKKEELAKALLDIINTKGFFYLKNFGISKEEVDRQFGIGSAFYAIPLEERMKARSAVEQGNSNGYRPAGRRPMGQSGLRGEPSPHFAPPVGDEKLTIWQTVQRNTTSPVSLFHVLLREVVSF
jgi:hypothetical protein